MNPIDSDNLMLVMLRDDENRGCMIGWSPEWINRCKKDPKMLVATVGNLGTALCVLADLMNGSKEIPLGPLVVEKKETIN